MSNHAAWLIAPGAPFKVDSAPMPKPGPNEVVVKNAFAAVNPLDWMTQDLRIGLNYFPVYPYILGCEVAGEISEVGEGVSNLKKGMRVMAHTTGTMDGRSAYGGFQLYTVCEAALVAAIPDTVSYEQAVVLPLAISTAAAGLYQEHCLALPKPSPSHPPCGWTVLVWGGSSSLGSTVIQLAVASGVDVFATADPDDFDYVKDLGASQVFDHSISSVVDDIVSVFRGSFRNFAGVYDAISSADTIKKSAMVVSQAVWPRKRLVVTGYAGGDLVPVDVEKTIVLPLTIVWNDVGPAVWGQFVPGALADGSLICKPDPLVVGEGLEMVQDALDRQKSGVGTEKMVVKLQGD